jgi:glyoxylase-like metal-dependent hydrolase (beta-lactamase superfamily II)
VKIHFFGTRGYIEESSRLHRMHSALLLSFAGKRLLLDAGETWSGRIGELDPNWIAITHAHPDHAFGLRGGTGVPVYVTSVTRRLLRGFPLSRLRTLTAGRWQAIGPFRVLAYTVVHSIRCPAVGFKVRAGRRTIVYNPDVISIDDRDRVLRDVDAFIGDGASLTRPLVRRRGDLLFGHTTVRAQLNWCKEAGIGRAFIVHCGKQIVEMNAREAQRRVDELAGPSVHATIAHDGMEVVL